MQKKRTVTASQKKAAANRNKSPKGKAGEKQAAGHSKRYYELRGLAFVVVGLIALCGILGLNVGFVGLKFAKFLQYFFGVGSIVASAGFLGIGGYYIMEHRRLVFNSKTVGGLVFFTTAMAMYHHFAVAVGQEIMPDSLVGGGGLLGGAIVLLLHNIIGSAGTPILLGAVLLGTLLVVTTWSLAKGILFTKEKAEQGADVAVKAGAAAYDKTVDIGSKAKVHVQEQAEEAKAYVQEHAEDAKAYVQERAEDAKEYVQERAGEAKEYVQERMTDAREYVQEQVSDVGDRLKSMRSKQNLAQYEKDSAFLMDAVEGEGVPVQQGPVIKTILEGGGDSGTVGTTADTSAGVTGNSPFWAPMGRMGNAGLGKTDGATMGGMSAGTTYNSPFGTPIGRTASANAGMSAGVAGGSMFGTPMGGEAGVSVGLGPDFGRAQDMGLVQEQGEDEEKIFTPPPASAEELVGANPTAVGFFGEKFSGEKFAYIKAQMADRAAEELASEQTEGPEEEPNNVSSWGSFGSGQNFGQGNIHIDQVQTQGFGLNDMAEMSGQENAEADVTTFNLARAEAGLQDPELEALRAKYGLMDDPVEAAEEAEPVEDIFDEDKLAQEAREFVSASFQHASLAEDFKAELQEDFVGSSAEAGNIPVTETAPDVGYVSDISAVAATESDYLPESEYMPDMEDIPANVDPETGEIYDYGIGDMAITYADGAADLTEDIPEPEDVDPAIWLSDTGHVDAGVAGAGKSVASGVATAGLAVSGAVASGVAAGMATGGASIATGAVSGMATAAAAGAVAGGASMAMTAGRAAGAMVDSSSMRGAIGVAVGSSETGNNMGTSAAGSSFNSGTPVVSTLAANSGAPTASMATIQNKTEAQEPPPPPYVLPSIELLSKKVKVMSDTLNQEIANNAKLLGETLADFKVKATILNACHGPAVTRYEVKPAPGVKVSKITGLAEDIALNLAATAVRIEQIPGKAAIGIEVPNRELESVQLREVLENPAFAAAKSRLTVGLGKDISGQAIFADLAKMPHLLVAGATGSGKSVCINTLITSVLFKALPTEVKFILIDPKMVELSVYNDIPHLMVPVVTDAKKAASVLNWAVQEMEKRYGLIAHEGVRNMDGYNRLFEEEPEKKLPSIVIIIDELADLMMVAPHDVEDAICRIAQKARAAGIYLVLATQRPSVNVITGVIKANIPSRISFAVTSQIDSRTILDAAGAEKLLGKGDMLFKPQEANKPTRIQGAFVSDQEVEDLVEYIKSQGHKLEANQEIIDFTNRAAESENEDEEEKGKSPKMKLDSLLRDAVELTLSTNNASASSFQRRYHIGYSRAGRLLDTMEQLGIVGPPQGSKPREILVTEAQAFEIMDNYEA